MMRDIGTMVWKEWRELLSQGGGRGKYYPLLFIGIFGVFMPIQSGEAWLEGIAPMSMMAWVPLLIIGGWVADSFAGERERHTLGTLLASRLPDTAILVGKLAALVAYGWSMVMASMLVGAIVTNIAHWSGRIAFYSLAVSIAGIVITFLTSLLAAGAGVLVSLKAETVRQAAQRLSLGIFVIVWIPILAIQLAPDSLRAQVAARLAGLGEVLDESQLLWAVGIGVAALLLIVDVILLSLAKARFRRSRLLLD